MDSYFFILVTSCSSFIQPHLFYVMPFCLFLALEVSMSQLGAPLTTMTMWTQFGE